MMVRVSSWGMDYANEVMVIKYSSVCVRLCGSSSKAFPDYVRQYLNSHELFLKTVLLMNFRNLSA